MLKLIPILLSLAACVDGATPAPDCGPFHISGRYAVRYQTVDGQPVAVLPRADFDGLISDLHAAKAWAICTGIE